MQSCFDLSADAVNLMDTLKVKSECSWYFKLVVWSRVEVKGVEPSQIRCLSLNEEAQRSTAPPVALW